MSGNRQKPPIFVAGFFRSGTSLVRRVLDSHPNIHCPSEIKLFKDLFGHYLDDHLAHVRFFQSLDSAGAPKAMVLETIGSAYIQLRHRMARKIGKPRWADKDPEHLLYLDSIEKIAPGFQLILCIRDPRDILSSLAEVGFTKTMPSIFEQRLARLVEHWQNAIQFLGSYPNRTHVIVYENLVREPTDCLRDLYDFIDEPYVPLVLERCFGPDYARGLEDPKIRLTSSIHQNSVGRWKRDLTRHESEQVMAHTGDLWRQLLAHRVGMGKMRI
jgi:protein-tyrosine sulfotransferase